MKIGIIVNTQKKDALSCLHEIAAVLNKAGAQLLLSNALSGKLDFEADYFNSDEDVVKNCNLAVTVGGDGTIIHSAKFASMYEKPLIGVNLGRVGFVAGVEKDEIQSLSKLVTGDFVTQSRMLLDVTLKSKSGEKSFLAVNEAALSRDTLSPIIEVCVALDNEKIITYRADGMLFATPTGSTAYSFSAGGPVLEPDMRCILLNPVCPHALSSRPVVFSENSELTASIKNDADVSCYLTVDGQDCVKLRRDDVITIRKAPTELELIILKRKNFYTLLNEKLKERD